MKIALIQMSVVEKNKNKNIEHGLELLRSVQVGTEVAVLPEMWTTGYSIGRLHEQAERMDGTVVEELRSIAIVQNMYIVAGSMAMEKNGRFYNTSLIISPQGGMVGSYDKIHLFSLYNEQAMFTAGAGRMVAEVAGVPSGVAICYDVRFPELGRALAQDGAKIVYIPAEWPEVRGYAWELAVKSFAMSNQVFVCAVNCVGTFKGKEFYGHSMLVSPWGVPVVQGGTAEEILYVDVDIAEVDAVRAELSMLQDVRWDMYK